MLKKSEGLLAIRCFGSANSGQFWGVPIDLHFALRWKGLSFYENHKILMNATWQNNVRVASPYHVVMIALLQRILYTGAVSRNYLLEGARIYALSSERVRKDLSRIFGKRSRFLISKLDNEETGELAEVAKKLRRGLLIRNVFRSPFTILQNRINNFSVHLNRLWRRPGIFLAVLGLDGSGKGTLIELVHRDFERLTHTQTRIQHARPNLLPSLARLFGRETHHSNSLTGPHGEAPGMMSSICRMVYYTIDFGLGYLIRVYPALVKYPTAFFFDRYFYDYLYDPARYRVRLPSWIIAFFALLVPKPDAVVLLAVPPEIAWKRKQEFPLEEVRVQFAKMQRLAKKLDQVVWIDTSGDIETARKQMLQAVLETFASKRR